MNRDNSCQNMYYTSILCLSLMKYDMIQIDFRVETIELSTAYNHSILIDHHQVDVKHFTYRQNRCHRHETGWSTANESHVKKA
jgi:hypothetical protein